MTAVHGLAVESPTIALLPEYLEMAERNAKRLARWEPWAAQPVTTGSIRHYLGWVQREVAGGHQLALVVRRDGRLAGSIGARLLGDAAEVGYWLDADAEGHGVAAWAVGELLAQLRDAGIRTAEAHTAVDNTRSIMLLGRLGFVRDDTPPPPTPLDLPRGRIPRARFTLRLAAR